MCGKHRPQPQLFSTLFEQLPISVSTILLPSPYYWPSDTGVQLETYVSSVDVFIVYRYHYWRLYLDKQEAQITEIFHGSTRLTQKLPSSTRFLCPDASNSGIYYSLMHFLLHPIVSSSNAVSTVFPLRISHKNRILKYQISPISHFNDHVFQFIIILNHKTELFIMFNTSYSI